MAKLLIDLASISTNSAQRSPRSMLMDEYKLLECFSSEMCRIRVRIHCKLCVSTAGLCVAFAFQYLLAELPLFRVALKL